MIVNRTSWEEAGIRFLSVMGSILPDRPMLCPYSKEVMTLTAKRRMKKDTL